MQRQFLLTLVGAAALACGAGAASAGGTAPRCGPYSAHTIASSRTARVYSDSGSVYGCSAKTHHRSRLGSAQPRPGENRVGPVALAAQTVAYGETRSGVDTVIATVVVRRLGDGNVRGTFPPLPNVHAAEMAESVDSVVVKRDGAVAWIAEGGSVVSAERTTEVVDVEHGHERLLDSTAAGIIDTRSLRLHGSTLIWTRAGQKRSSTLR